jgi:hypothetical protein
VRICCHVPITLRIVGVPTDDQLAAVGTALARAVAARLAEAERLLGERHGHPAGGLALASYQVGGGAAGPHPPRPQVPLAHFDAAGAKRYEEHAGVLRHGGDPNAPVHHQRDAFDDALRDAAAQSARTAGILPGDHQQQEDTISEPDLEGLWQLPHVQAAFQALAQHMEAFGQGRPDAAFWLRYWHARFTASVRYILVVRPTHPYADKAAKKPRRVTYAARTAHLLKLRDAEADLLAHPPTRGGGEENAMRAMGLVHAAREVRDAARAEWLDEVNQAADRFLVVAENEARFRTEGQNAREVQVYGLPEQLEGTLPASAFPKLFDQDAPGFSPSTARFMTALQQASGQQVLAINYGGHELANPFVGEREDVGLYSFDLQPNIAKDTSGFYEHDAAVKFFLAMEQAGQETGIAWTAYYNDFSVAKEVNEHIGWRRIGFSGGGGPANARPDEEGSFHHGPAPYILHIHVNIMPTRLAQQYFAGREDLPPSLDLGQHP